jgi:hypothetical protein
MKYHVAPPLKQEPVDCKCGLTIFFGDLPLSVFSYYNESLGRLKLENKKAFQILFFDAGG